MKIKLRGSFEDKGGVPKEFSLESEQGMTLEISSGSGEVCKIECSCMHGTIATRVNIWGDLSVELDYNDVKLNGYHVVVKRV